MRQSDMQVEYRGGEKVAYLKSGTEDANPEAFIQMAREAGAVPRDYNGVVEAVARDEMEYSKTAEAIAMVTFGAHNTATRVGFSNSIRDSAGIRNLERTEDIFADAKLLMHTGNAYADESQQRQERAEYLLREIGKQ